MRLKGKCQLKKLPTAHCPAHGGKSLKGSCRGSATWAPIAYSCCDLLTCREVPRRPSCVPGHGAGCCANIERRDGLCPKDTGHAERSLLLSHSRALATWSDLDLVRTWRAARAQTHKSNPIAAAKTSSIKLVEASVLATL